MNPTHLLIAFLSKHSHHNSKWTSPKPEGAPLEKEISGIKSLNSSLANSVTWQLVTDI